MSEMGAEFHGEATLSQKVMRAKVCPTCATTGIAWDAEVCPKCGVDLSDVQGPVEDLGVTSRGEF